MEKRLTEGEIRNLSTLLRARIIPKYKTQRALCEGLKINPAQFSAAINGDRAFGAALREALAEVAGMTPEEFDRHLLRGSEEIDEAGFGKLRHAAEQYADHGQHAQAAGAFYELVPVCAAREEFYEAAHWAAKAAIHRRHLSEYHTALELLREARLQFEKADEGHVRVLAAGVIPKVLNPHLELFRIWIESELLAAEWKKADAAYGKLIRTIKALEQEMAGNLRAVRSLRHDRLHAFRHRAEILYLSGDYMLAASKFEKIRNDSLECYEIEGAVWANLNHARARRMLLSPDGKEDETVLHELDDVIWAAEKFSAPRVKWYAVSTQLKLFTSRGDRKAYDQLRRETDKDASQQQCSQRRGLYELILDAVWSMQSRKGKEEAKNSLKKALTISEKLGIQYEAALCQLGLAECLRLSGKAAKSIAAAQKALVQFQISGCRWGSLRAGIILAMQSDLPPVENHDFQGVDAALFEAWQRAPFDGKDCLLKNLL